MRKREKISLARKLLKRVEEVEDCSRVCPAKLLLKKVPRTLTFEEESIIYNEVKEGFCHFLFPELKYYQRNICGPCPCREAGHLLNLTKKQIMDEVRKLAEEGK